MTCPTCNDAGFIETRTSGGLVERKACEHDPALFPSVPCPCGGPGAMTRCMACANSPRAASWPFDPEPRALEPAQNGYIWCDGCESVQPVTGHECGTIPNAELLMELARQLEIADAEIEKLRARTIHLATGWREEDARAEFAESLLMAMAWDHASLTGAHRANLDSGCVFCDAARGGGR